MLGSQKDRGAKGAKGDGRPKVSGGQNTLKAKRSNFRVKDEQQEQQEQEQQEQVE